MPGHLGKHSLWPWAHCLAFSKHNLDLSVSVTGGNEADWSVAVYSQPTGWSSVLLWVMLLDRVKHDTNGDSFVSQMGKLRPKNAKLVSTNWILRDVKKQGSLQQKRAFILPSPSSLALGANTQDSYTPGQSQSEKGRRECAQLIGAKQL